jgi:signal peptidase I
MRSSAAPIAHGGPVRPRLPHAKTVAFMASQLALVAALLWFCLPQRLGGRADWVMVSGTSMLPHLHTGDLVLVERRSSYHVGEVVAYRVPNGQVGAGYTVIHRIIGGNGKTGWRMKGGNRTAPDLWHPKSSDVIGRKLVRVPHAWFVLRLLHMPILLALFAGFAAFFTIVFGGGGKDDPGETEEMG